MFWCGAQCERSYPASEYGKNQYCGGESRDFFISSCYLIIGTFRDPVKVLSRIQYDTFLMLDFFFREQRTVRLKYLFLFLLIYKLCLYFFIKLNCSTIRRQI